MQKGKKVPKTNRFSALLLKLWDYTFDLKYPWGEMFISNALFWLHIEAQRHAIILNFLHLNKAHIYHSYKHLAYALQKHKLKKQVQIKPKTRDTTKNHQMGADDSYKKPKHLTQCKQNIEHTCTTVQINSQNTSENIIDSTWRYLM